jgi:hypothetical protein
MWKIFWNLRKQIILPEIRKKISGVFVGRIKPCSEMSSNELQSQGGSIAELLTRPLIVPKVRGLNLDTNYCCIRAPIIWNNVRIKVSNYTYVSYGFGTLNHFEMVQGVEVCSHFESSNRSQTSL